MISRRDTLVAVKRPPGWICSLTLRPAELLGLTDATSNASAASLVSAGVAGGACVTTTVSTLPGYGVWATRTVPNTPRPAASQLMCLRVITHTSSTCPRKPNGFATRRDSHASKDAGRPDPAFGRNRIIALKTAQLPCLRYHLFLFRPEVRFLLSGRTVGRRAGLTVRSGLRTLETTQPPDTRCLACRYLPLTNLIHRMAEVQSSPAHLRAPPCRRCRGRRLFAGPDPAM